LGAQFSATRGLPYLSFYWMLFLTTFALPVEGVAEVQTIAATGTYRMGPHDDGTDARRLAVLDAKTAALRRAGEILGEIPAISRLGLDQDKLTAYLGALLELREQGSAEGRAEGGMTAEVTAELDPPALERRLRALLESERAKAELVRARDKVQTSRIAIEADSTRLRTSTNPAEAARLAQHRRDLLDLVDTQGQFIRTWGLLLGTAPSQAAVKPAAASDNAEEHRKKGVALNREARYEEAVKEFRLALSLVPTLPRARLGLGAALQGQGDLDGAVTEYLAELRTRPDDADAHNNLGTVLQQKGSLEGAIAEYRLALGANPDDALTHFNLGTALAASGKPDEAISEYRTAIRLRSDFLEAYFNLGAALKSKGETAEARESFETFARLASDNPALRTWLEQAKQVLQEIGDEPRRFRRQADHGVAR
jgi:tetratricopeptide (TPR) repeat protein